MLIGTPYAYISSHDKTKIIVGRRFFDGIEVDRTDMLKLTPDNARWLAEELYKLAESIDHKKERTSVAKKIHNNTQKIIKQARKEVGL